MIAISRRMLMAGTAAVLGTGLARASEAPLDLDWADLIPREEGTPMEEMRSIMGIIEHGELSTGFEQERDASLTTAYNGKRIRLPGFMVPIDYEGTGVKQLLLVPYVGACIHVPPPPPNQIVMVTAERPYEVTGYFEPIYVTGTLQTAVVSTELAEIGYVIEDARITPYEAS